MLKTSDLDFPYPSELVALTPKPRGESRILKINRENSLFEEITWPDLSLLFNKGDVLVLNDSQVLKARLLVKKPSGKPGEVMFLAADRSNPNFWEVMTGGLNPRDGKEINLPGDLKIKILSSGKICRAQVIGTEFKSFGELAQYFQTYGQVPLPPYIHQLRSQKQNPEDESRYQTLWAKIWGSVAAPTAGLHFDKKFLQRLEEKGVQIAYVTLHVGAGTFLPLEDTDFSKIELHSEFVEVGKDCCQKILTSKAKGKKTWACGTTVVRSLETAMAASKSPGHLPLIEPFIGETKLFIEPGYQFRVVDSMLTNFHQPKSSLLALVSAFASTKIPFSRAEKLEVVDKIKRAYAFAIERKFRLFSYGDLTVIT